MALWGGESTLKIRGKRMLAVFNFCRHNSFWPRQIRFSSGPARKLKRTGLQNIGIMLLKSELDDGKNASYPSEQASRRIQFDPGGIPVQADDAKLTGVQEGKGPRHSKTAGSW